jgi:hypothetical protein
MSFRCASRASILAGVLPLLAGEEGGGANAEGELLGWLFITGLTFCGPPGTCMGQLGPMTCMGQLGEHSKLPTCEVVVDAQLKYVS